MKYSEALQFMRETWEILYWSFWCPSRLERHMSRFQSKEIDPETGEDLVPVSEILLYKKRFSIQVLILLCVFGLIMTWVLWEQRQLSGFWWLIPIIIFFSYAISFLAPMISFILAASLLIVLSEISIVNDTFQQLTLFLSYTNQLHIATLGLLSISTGLDFLIFLYQANNLTSKWNIRIFYVVISIFSGIGFTFKISPEIISLYDLRIVLSAALMILFTAFLLLVGNLRKNQNKSDLLDASLVLFYIFVGAVIGKSLDMPNAESFAMIFPSSMIVVSGTLLDIVDEEFEKPPVAMGGVLGHTLGLLLIRAIIIIPILGWSIFSMILSRTSMLSTLGGMTILSLGLSAASMPASVNFKQLLGWGVFSGIFSLLIFENQGWLSLALPPVFLIVYYRIIPDYLCLSIVGLLSYLVSNYPLPGFRVSALKLLKQFPPYSTEILFLPVVNHANLISKSFEKLDIDLAIKSLEEIRASDAPGIRKTLRDIVPQVMALELGKVCSVQSIKDIFLGNNLVVEYLFPGAEIGQEQFSLHNEVAIIYSPLRKVFTDLENADRASNSALRERAYRRISENLDKLEKSLFELNWNRRQAERWRPVVQHWKSIVDLTITNSSTELLNPYQWGNPLKGQSATLFQGRRDLGERILRLILDRSRPTLVLYGPRRFGKSSFLLNLSRFLSSDVIPVFLDLQSPACTSDEAAFCQAITRAISQDGRSQGYEVPGAPNRSEFLRNGHYLVLEEWLEKTTSILGERRLLLCLDEFEKIGEAIIKGRMSSQVFDQLRHLIQHHDKLGFLFCGGQTLDEMGPNWSSYFISVIPIKLDYLQLDEAQKLLIEPDPDFTLRYGPGVVEAIIRTARCHPYLLQLIAWCLVNVANEAGTDLATPELLDIAIEQALTSGQPYFDNFWQEYTGPVGDQEAIAAGRQFLVNLARRGQGAVNPNSLAQQRAIDRLVRYRVLVADGAGSYRFDVPMVEKWVRDRARLDLAN